MTDPYAVKRRTVVDYRFHTKEQQDFYETVLLDKKFIVCDMRWVDWKYIRENEGTILESMIVSSLVDRGLCWAKAPKVA